MCEARATTVARGRRVHTLYRLCCAAALRRRRRAGIRPSFVPQTAYDALHRAAGGTREVARPRHAFDSMWTASPRLDAHYHGFLRRSDWRSAPVDALLMVPGALSLLRGRRVLRSAGLKGGDRTFTLSALLTDFTGTCAGRQHSALSLIHI